MSATINSSATLHQGRVFNLVKENYTLDNGVTSEMDFVQHPGAAAMVPMLNNQEVVLKLEEKVSGTNHFREYKSTRYRLRRSFTSDFDF